MLCAQNKLCCQRPLRQELAVRVAAPSSSARSRSRNASSRAGSNTLGRLSCSIEKLEWRGSGYICGNLVRGSPQTLHSDACSQLNFGARKQRWLDFRI